MNGCKSIETVPQALVWIDVALIVAVAVAIGLLLWRTGALRRDQGGGQR